MSGRRLGEWRVVVNWNDFAEDVFVQRMGEVN